MLSVVASLKTGGLGEKGKTVTRSGARPGAEGETVRWGPATGADAPAPQPSGARRPVVVSHSGAGTLKPRRQDLLLIRTPGWAKNRWFGGARV